MATFQPHAVNSGSPTEGRDEGSAQKLLGNKFANDGSFFEMFRRKMEEKERANCKDTQVQVSKDTPSRLDVPVEGRTECRTEGSSEREKRKEEGTQSKPYQVVPWMTHYKMAVCVCVWWRREELS